MFDNIDPTWAWSPYEPSDRNPWDLRKVGHLYRRAAFGASWPELESGLKAGHAATLDRLLKGGPGLDAHDREMGHMAKTPIGQNNELLLRAWWLFRMLGTPHPLREKITLFWHNHFATSNAKVNNLRYMLGQNELMRKHALGRFDVMLQDMSKDPAMMVWLDTNLSKKGQPNENYSRELMELFSLGIGNYTENDVREGAKAFTGWELKNGQFFFNKAQHDATEKNYLSRKGKFGGEDIVKICLEQPSCSYRTSLRASSIVSSSAKAQRLPRSCWSRWRRSFVAAGTSARLSRRCSARTCSSRSTLTGPA
jgi:hypothetical protein